MLRILLLTLLIVAICVLFLGVKIFFIKGGKFSSKHISQSKAMRQRGIYCAIKQDIDARKKSIYCVDEMKKK